MATVAPAQTSSSAVSVTPRSWSFIDRSTGETVEYTCMNGCTLNHASDMATPTHREDVWCWFWDENLTLPINENGTPEELRVLSTVIKVEPWSPSISQRLPYAVVELVDDQFVENLDPDGYETVINALQERLDQMWANHRRLVEIRAQYMARQTAA